MRINIDDTDLDDANTYLYNGVPFTGEMVETTEAGTIIASTWVRGGTPHGPDLSWYPDGRLETETNLDNGVAVGTSRQWHPNGQLADQREFTDQGKLVSVHRWSEDGVVVESRYTGEGGKVTSTTSRASHGERDGETVGKTVPAADGS